MARGQLSTTAKHGDRASLAEQHSLHFYTGHVKQEGAVVMASTGCPLWLHRDLSALEEANQISQVPQSLKPHPEHRWLPVKTECETR